MLRSPVNRKFFVSLCSASFVLCIQQHSAAFAFQSPSDSAQKRDLTEQELQKLAKSLRSPEVLERRRAAYALEDLGPAGLAILPALIQALDDPDDQVAKASARAIGSLGEEGKAALPDLSKQLTSDDDYLVYWVALAIRSIGGPDNREAVRQLLLRKSQKLGTPLIYNEYLETHTETSLPILLELLTDSVPLVRQRSAEAIGVLAYHRRADPWIELDSKEKEKVRNALWNLHQDASWDVHLAASKSLVQIDPNEIARVAPTLIEALSRGVDGAKGTANYLQGVPEIAVPRILDGLVAGRFTNPLDGTMVLAYMPTHSQTAFQELLVHPSRELRIAAAQSLTAYGLRDYPEDGTKLLLPALQDADEEVRLVAAESMVTLATERSSQAEPILNEILRNTTTDRRVRAAQALQKLGRAGSSSAENLRHNLHSRHAELRLASALALVAVQPSRAEMAIPILKSAINVPDPAQPFAQRAAVVAAGNLGRLGQPLVDDLSALLQPAGPNKNLYLQIEAAEALLKIDPSQPDQPVKRLAEIVEGKTNKSSGLRMAMLALVRQASVSKAAIPAMVLSSRRTKGPFRPNAAVALIKIDPANQREHWDFVLQKYWQDNQVLRGGVLRALLEYEIAPKPLLTELQSMLSENTPGLELVRAIRLVGSCGGDAASSVPALEKLTSHSERSVQKAARLAIKQIQGTDDS